MSGNDDEAAASQVQENVHIQETLEATVTANAAAPALEIPSEGGYDPLRYQDATRSYIAYWLLSLLTVMVVGGLAMLFARPSVTFENLKSILELIFGPVVALVSAATGFYFGAHQPGSDKRR